MSKSSFVQATLHNATGTVGAGAMIELRSRADGVRDKCIIYPVGTATTLVSAVEVSLDGTSWAAAGVALAHGDFLKTVVVPTSGARYLRVNTTTITGGIITIIAVAWSS